MKTRSVVLVLLVLWMVASLILNPVGAQTPPPQADDTSSVAHKGETRVYRSSPRRTISAAGSEDILLIQTSDPWENSGHYVGNNWYDGITSDTEVLDSLGYSYRIATWDDIESGAVNIFSYPVVLIVNDQVQEFYDDYAAHVTEFENYVAGGHTLVFFAAGYGWADGILNAPLPGGITWNLSGMADVAERNVIVDSGHPIVTAELSNGIPLTDSDLYSNYCSHGWFSNLLAGTNIILRESPEEGNNPTLIEYTLGIGRVVASTLTWEHSWSYHTGSDGYGTFARKALDDVFLYAFSGGATPADITLDLRVEDAPSWVAVNKSVDSYVDVVARVTGSDAYTSIVTLQIPSDMFGTPVKTSTRDHPSNTGYGQENQYTNLGGGQYQIETVLQPLPSGAQTFYKEIVWRFRVPDSVTPQQGIELAATISVSGHTVDNPTDTAQLSIIDYARSLIVTNRKLLFSKYQPDPTQNDVSPLLERLYSKAWIYDGEVFYVELYDDTAANWSQDTNENTANTVATTIDGFIEEWYNRLTKHPHWWETVKPEFLLIVGGDEIIPFWRVHAPDYDDNDEDIVPDLCPNSDPVLDALCDEYFFSDNVYADVGGGQSDWEKGKLELSTGRIVGASASDMLNFIQSASLDTEPLQAAVLASLEGSQVDDMLDKLNAKHIDITGLDNPDMVDNNNWTRQQWLTAWQENWQLNYYGGHGHYERIPGPGWGINAIDMVDLPAGHIAQNHPLLIADACNLGVPTDQNGAAWQPEPDDSVMYKLANLGMAGMVASTGISSYMPDIGFIKIKAYGEALINDYVEHLIDTGSFLVPASAYSEYFGTALLEAKRHYNPFLIGWNGTDKKTMLEYVYYGLPWSFMETPDNQASAALATVETRGYHISSAAPQAAVLDSYSKVFTTTISNYQFASLDGFELLEIPGADHLFTFREPVLPIIYTTFALPPGATVSSIELVGEQSTLLGQHNIPAADPATMYHPTIGYTSTMSVSGVYPPAPRYGYEVNDLGDWTEVRVAIAPATFNVDTHEVTLYEVTSLRINYDASVPVVISALSLDKPQYQYGKMITTTASVENVGPSPVTLVAQLNVYDSVGTLVGTASSAPFNVNGGESYQLQLLWDQSLPPGGYRAVLSLEEAGTPQVAALASFNVLAGAISSFNAPTSLAHGEYGSFNLAFANYHPTAVTATAKVYICNQLGMEVASLLQRTFVVEPNSVGTTSWSWEPSSLPAGKYTVQAVVQVNDETYLSDLANIQIVEPLIIQVTDAPADDWRPAIACTSDGKLWVVWHSWRSDNNVWYKTSDDNGVTWSADTQLTTDPSSDYDPAIMQASDGTIWVVWYSWRSGNADIWYKTSTDGGITWSDATQLTTEPNSDYSPAIMQASDGTIWVVWYSYRSGNADLWYKTTSDGGATWSSAVQLTTALEYDYCPAIAQTSDGIIWVLWDSWRSDHPAVWYKTSTDGGTFWSPDAEFSTDTNWDYDPAIGQTSDGTIWIARMSWSWDLWNWDIWYKTSNDDGTTWSADQQFTQFTGPDLYPGLTALPGDQVALVWSSDRAVNYDVWFGIIGIHSDVNPPPHLDSIQNYPWPNPDSNDIVTIRADVSDETGIASVILKWSVDGTPQADLTMYDDGAHDDYGADDGWYGVQIGPFPVGTEVEYQVEVTDVDGNTVLAPQYPMWFESLEPFVKTADILFVPDYGGNDTGWFRNYYEDALGVLGYLYDVWDTGLRGEIDSATLNQYANGAVIWAVPYWGFVTDYDSTRNTLQSFLDSGGNLFITGQNIGSYAGWTSFYQDYLHADYVQDNVGLTNLTGVPGDPVGDGLSFSIAGGDGANNQYSPDEIDPVSPAVTILTYSGGALAQGELRLPKGMEEREPFVEPGPPVSDGQLIQRGKPERMWMTAELQDVVSSGSGAIRVDTGTYKVVYFAFGFEGINSRLDRRTVMGRVMNWFGMTPPADIVQVTTNAADDWLPSLAHTNDGKLWVVWFSYRSGNYDLWYKTSDDNGVTWSAATQLTTDPNRDCEPAITQASDGTLWVVWTSWRSGNGDIWYKTSTDGGTTWSADTQLTYSGFEWLPAITQASDGTLWVVWTSYRFGNDDVWYKISTDGGVTWSPDTQLTFTGSDWRPAMTQASDGTLWVVWSSYRSGNEDIWYKTSTDGGTTWSADTQLTYSGFEWLPAITQASDGTLWVVWTSYRSGYDDVWYKTSTDGGVTWSAPHQWTRFVGADMYPAVVAMSGGPVAVAWVSDRAANLDIWFGIFGEQGDINPPPYIDWIEHQPSPNPYSDDIITIQGWARDETGLSGAELLWGINGVGQANLPMYDDGAHDDGGAGDGQYGVQIGPLVAGTSVTYTVQATDVDGNHYTYPDTCSFEVLEPFVKTADILFVPDYGGNDTDWFQPYFADALDTLGYGYDVWDTGLRGAPDSAILDLYTDGVVIWAVPYGGYFDDSDVRPDIEDYLDAGGKLFITGQDVAYATAGTSFLNDYLHALYVQDDPGLRSLAGAAGDPIGDGLTIGISGGDGADNQWYPDEIDPISPAVTVFTYDTIALIKPVKPEVARPKQEGGERGATLIPAPWRESQESPRKPAEVESAADLQDIISSGTGGLRVDTGTCKVVFFSFGFEAINNQADRNEVMDLVITWLMACSDPHEPNDTPGQATPIAYSTTLTDPDICPLGDVDYYSFAGSAGDVIIADIDAYVIGSLLDSYLYLYDTDGVTELTHNDDYDGFDSRVTYILPADGTYYLMVREFNHPNEGGADYFYTLSLAQGPPPFDVNAGWTSSAPTVDGQILAGEWDDAAVYEISVALSSHSQKQWSLGAEALSEALLREQEQRQMSVEPKALLSTVTLYAMNDGTHLYLAIDNPNDSSEDDYDQMGVYFDDNPLPSNGQWTNTSCGHPDGEGNFWVLTDTVKYREWIAGPDTCDVVTPAPGTDGAVGYDSGHVQAEIAMDLTSSALRATPGDGINMYLWIYDANTGILDGQWPITTDFQDPSTYGLLTLATGEVVISNVRTSNARDTSFTVSWTTDTPSNGRVNYGTNPANLNQTAYDDRGAGTSDDTHHATLTGLTPETTYYFDVVSGGTTDDNSGAHYTVTTGPTLGLPGSDTIWGQVFKEDGTTLAEGAIVYITLQDADGSGSPDEAATLSALVDDTGYWTTNLGNARLADLSGYFEYSASGDSITLLAKGAAEGCARQTVDTSADTPAADMILSGCYLPGDLDCDGRVNIDDVMMVANRWRCRCGDDCYDPYYDLDDDCDIDVVDIMKVVKHWGETCP